MPCCHLNENGSCIPQYQPCCHLNETFCPARNHCIGFTERCCPNGTHFCPTNGSCIPQYQPCCHLNETFCPARNYCIGFTERCCPNGTHFCSTNGSCIPQYQPCCHLNETFCPAQKKCIKSRKDCAISYPTVWKFFPLGQIKEIFKNGVVAILLHSVEMFGVDGSLMVYSAPSWNKVENLSSNNAFVVGPATHLRYDKQTDPMVIM